MGGGSKHIKKKSVYVPEKGNSIVLKSGEYSERNPSETPASWHISLSFSLQLIRALSINIIERSDSGYGLQNGGTQFLIKVLKISAVYAPWKTLYAMHPSTVQTSSIDNRIECFTEWASTAGIPFKDHLNRWSLVYLLAADSSTTTTWQLRQMAWRGRNQSRSWRFLSFAWDSSFFFVYLMGAY